MAGKSLGTLTLDLILKMGGFEQGMDKAARLTDKRMREMEARAKKFGVAIGAAVAAGAVAVAAGVKSAIDYADQLNDMNQRLGVSAEALSGWAYAAKQSGTDIDALGIGLKKLAKNMAEALDPKTSQGKLFDALGVSVTDAAGRLRDVEDVLPEIASKFKDLDNATQESALAMDLFGKSGADLLEFLNQGGDGLETLRDRARELGVELDGNTLAAADQFNDTLGDIGTIVQGLFTQIAKDLLPTLLEAAKAFRNLAQDGDLARNAATLLSGALDFGVTALRNYNDAVAKLSIEIEGFVGLMTGLAEVQKNWLSFGIADGSIAGGYDKIAAAIRGESKALEDLAANRELASAGMNRKQYTENFIGQFGANIPGLPKPSTFPQLPFNFAADQAKNNKPASVEDALKKYYGGDPAKPKGGGKSNGRSLEDEAVAAKKALDEQIKSVIAAREEFDSLAASLSGPLAEAFYRYTVENQRLIDTAKAGEVGTKELEKAQADLRKEYDENVESIKKQLDPLGQLLADLEFENSLLGMTNAERMIAIETRGMDADAIAKQSGALGKLKDAYANGEQMREQIGLMEEFRDSVGGIFSDIRDGASAWDAVKDAFDNFADAIFDFASKKVMEQLFGQMGTSQTGSAGGWISALLGAFSGSGGGFAASSGGVSGQAFADVFSNGGAFGFASGGLMPGNSFARVNELGPELMTVRGRDYLMTGNDAVTITPNHKLGGANGSVSVTQVFNNPRMYDRSTSAHREAEAARKLKDSMRFA